MFRVLGRCRINGPHIGIAEWSSVEHNLLLVLGELGLFCTSHLENGSLICEGWCSVVDGIWFFGDLECIPSNLFSISRYWTILNWCSNLDTLLPCYGWLHLWQLFGPFGRKGVAGAVRTKLLPSELSPYPVCYCTILWVVLVRTACESIAMINLCCMGNPTLILQPSNNPKIVPPAIGLLESFETLM